MVIISKTIVQAFSRKHGDAAAALNSWYKIVAQADWETLTRRVMTLIAWML